MHSRLFREELEYSLPEDEKPYEASARSRFDSPEFYAVFQNILRTLMLFRSVRGALDRPGFSKDLKAIAAATSEEFVQAALHESRPRSNEDLIHTAGCEKVCTALRHLLFSTATVPLTDGYRMRCDYLGTAMKLMFGPLTVFHTHNYADNYSAEILTMYGCDPPMAEGKQNITMPTLQQMHKNTAASPRSTAKFFLWTGRKSAISVWLQLLAPRMAAKSSFLPCQKILALVRSSKNSKADRLGDGYKRVTPDVEDLLSIENPTEVAGQKTHTLSAICTLDNLPQYRLDPPRGGTQAALVTLTAKTDVSFVVESVQLLSSDEADQAKHSLLKLLHMAIHIHSRDRKRTVEWTDGFSPITGARKCTRVGRSPTDAPLPEP